MSKIWKGSMVLFAVLGLTACGGPVEEEPAPAVDSVEQELRSCKAWEPPCPTGYQCVSGVCRPILVD